MQGLETQRPWQLPRRSPWLQLLWSDARPGLRQPGAARKILHYPLPQSESQIQRFELILPIYSLCRPAGTRACLCPLNLLFPPSVIFHLAPASTCSPNLLRFLLDLCKTDLIFPEPHHRARACDEETRIYVYIYIYICSWYSRLLSTIGMGAYFANSAVWNSLRTRIILLLSYQRGWFGLSVPRGRGRGGRGCGEEQGVGVRRRCPSASACTPVPARVSTGPQMNTASGFNDGTGK